MTARDELIECMAVAMPCPRCGVEAQVSCWGWSPYNKQGTRRKLETLPHEERIEAARTVLGVVEARYGEVRVRQSPAHPWHFHIRSMGTPTPTTSRAE